MAKAALQESKNLKPIKSIEDLLVRIQSYYSNADLAFIRKAYDFSEKCHSGQIRRSGEAYISHPLSVAGILTDLNLDLPSIATGLLHDTVEDTHATLDEIEKQFGKVVSELVDGVTKLSQMEFRNTHAKQGENIRKMIVAMGRDIRVILVKLADRLHNMRTLNHMPYEKQSRIAQETLDIYAPLAHRLGLNEWKIELEDLSMRYLKPDIYYDLAEKVAKKKKEREAYIEKVKNILRDKLGEANIKCEISGRPKNLFSIYKKMQTRNIGFDQVHDILAFRIMVENLAQCYEALGIVHSLYRPIPGRFKDYIAMAKANNYQSLHTTVIGPDAERVEIQIRTQQMHEIAERGIAAHWNYKEGGTADATGINKFNWLKDLVTAHQQTNDSNEFLESIKTELFESEIYVFTPKGDVFELPEGATPLDLAYTIHTDLGHMTIGAKVDGKIVPLRHALKNGDTVEILSSKTQKPSKDWLKFCITNRAKSKIRAFIRIEERKRSIEIGKELVEKEFRSKALSTQKIFKDESSEEVQKLLKAMKVANLEDMYLQLGFGKLLASQISEFIAPNAKATGEPEVPTFLSKVIKSVVNKRRKSGSMIEVDGMADLLVRFAKCCNPIPGDSIIGFISRGRGVTVHTATCPKAYAVDVERRVDVAWNSSVDTARTTKIRVVSNDAPGLLKMMSEAFATQGVNINNAKIRTNKDHKAICIFEVSVKDVRQLLDVIKNLQKIKGVIQVDRVTQA